MLRFGMFRLKRLLPFLIAGLLGVAAVVVMQRYITGERVELEELRRKLVADYENPVEVVIARRDITEGATISPEVLERSLVPPKFIQPYATARAADLVGRVARVPIAKGEQVMTNKLALPGKPLADTLAGITPQGRRAVTIGTDVLTAVGGFIQPGDQVDVLWTFQAPSPTGQGTELVTTTLFQDVQVLAVDTQMIGSDEEGKKAGSVAMATLALTPHETEFLLFAREQGQVALSLRSDLEQAGALTVPPASLSGVMELVFGAPLQPLEPPPEPRNVEVFKGLDRSVVTVTPGKAAARLDQ